MRMSRGTHKRRDRHPTQHSKLPHTTAPSTLLEGVVKDLLGNLQQGTQAVVHPRAVAFRSKYLKERANGIADLDTIEELWDALPRTRESNYFALIADPHDRDSAGNASLTFQAIAFLHDENAPGWHILMFDEHILEESDVQGLSDFIDWAPSRYIASQFGAIAQMMTVSARRERHPVITIRYGDAGGQGAPPLEIEGGGHNFLNNIGILSALSWIHATAALNNTPIKPSDGRARGFQIINLAAVHSGVTQWWDENHFNPERYNSRPNNAMETPPESP
ncbi:hypothetical protein HO173_003162 [Letharia columbiana]|uniref:Uncharacterized protein n=1 Tax=Letharia columbiana TaxID=112416 RepID=A0A8H6G1A8_9LECA|nr:uncharacterized protein HO173_003162 [Letharia columbiana]KAF6238656.1 hypothetical protein HO173_003162 [Letharia columbiana]